MSDRHSDEDEAESFLARELRKVVTVLLGICILQEMGLGEVSGGAAGPERSDIPKAILGKAPAPKGQDLAYFAEDPKARGYLAVPSREGPRGAVILIHEWNGLVERIKQIADVFAAEGYVALAADLYSGRIGNNREENMALVREARANPKRMIANLDAAARFLALRGPRPGDEPRPGRGCLETLESLPRAYHWTGIGVNFSFRVLGSRDQYSFSNRNFRERVPTGAVAIPRFLTVVEG